MGAGEVARWAAVDTEYSACSVEVRGALVATGTYQVAQVEGEEGVGEAPPTQRLGRLYMHRIGAEEGEEGGLALTEVERVERAAVLDMKWRPGEEARLGVADAGGRLTVYSVGEEGEGGLVEEASLATIPGLALALDWTTDGGLAASDSKGGLAVAAWGAAGLEEVWRAEGHGFEAWTVSCSRHHPALLYSGGDDCAFVLWDTRVEGRVGRNTREHSMGVTTATTSREEEQVVWTGSYDEQVRTWDTRSLKAPVAAVAVGGGVWRVRERAGRLLVAAMHDGFKVVEGGAVVAEYRGHGSLAYGADWVAEGVAGRGEGWATAATCSFYDHQLHLWSVRL